MSTPGSTSDILAGAGAGPRISVRAQIRVVPLIYPTNWIRSLFASDSSSESSWAHTGQGRRSPKECLKGFCNSSECVPLQMSVIGQLKLLLFVPDGKRSIDRLLHRSPANTLAVGEDLQRGFQLALATQISVKDK